MLISRWGWTGIAAGAAVLAAGAAMLTTAPTRNVSLPEVSVHADAEKPAETQQVRAEAVGSEAFEATEITYLLKLSGDTLSVYAAGSRTPAEQYTVPAGLPDYDRILLEYGMEVTSERELRLLLEDYLS